MDLNHRPPGPEPGALARLSHAPTACNNFENNYKLPIFAIGGGRSKRNYVPTKTLSHGWPERELQLNIAAEGAATLASVADPVRRPIRVGGPSASVTDSHLWPRLAKTTKPRHLVYPRGHPLPWLLRNTYCRSSTTCAGWCRATRGPACSPTR